MNKSIDIELVSKPRTYELQHLLSIKMTEFLENSSLYAIRRVLPGKSSLMSLSYQTFFNSLAELDTIYRQMVSDEDDEDEETDMKRESNKINEYLTYNWFESLLSLSL